MRPSTSPQVDLTDTQRRVLRATAIDQQHPGSLLQDFTMLLDFIAEMEPPLTGAHVLPMKVLEPLNARLTRPLQHALNRPQQKSFPPINGLYWLVRASGLTWIDATGKKPRLVIDPVTNDSWQRLNPTEQYCTLLESWTLRAQSEIIDERDRLGTNHVVEYWNNLFQRVPDSGLIVAGNPALEQSLSYWPGYHNLALMELFGIVKVQTATPVTGKGWRIGTLQRTPLGDALLIPLFQFIYGNPQEQKDWGMRFQYERPSSIPIGALQPILHPYFPAWQNNLVIGETTCGDGLYTFKVALAKDLWRRMTIPAQAVLDELSDAILAAYQFDNDHLYRFIYTNRFGGQDEVNHPELHEPPFTTEVCVGELPLRLGDTMTYHFDFGDNWRFAVTLERIDPAAPHQQAAVLIEEQGAAPAQYDVWGDDTDEDTGEDADED